MNTFIRNLSLIVLGGLAGCQLQPNEDSQMQPSQPHMGGTLQPLYQSSFCGPAPSDDLSAVWLPDQASLDQRWRRLSSQPLNPKPTPQLSSPRHTALLIYQGNKPSAGYALWLQDLKLRLTEQQGVIQLRLQQPQAGFATAAVMSSPCLLLELPEGRYTELQLLDQAGRPLTRLQRPGNR